MPHGLGHQQVCERRFKQILLVREMAGYLGGSVVKNLPVMYETEVRPLGGKIPWRRKWQPLQYSCLENPMDRRAW